MVNLKQINLNTEEIETIKEVLSNTLSETEFENLTEEENLLRNRTITAIEKLEGWLK